MLISRLWNYIRGYVIIVVEGYFLEKFINICTHRQLRLWSVRWQKKSRLTLKICINDFKKIRPVARKTKCRVHILKKKGVPFILHRYRNRKAFVIGWAVFVVTFFFIASFVWDVTITGNEKVATDEIMERLYDNGIRQGALKYGIDLEKVVNNMMLEIDDLARISISLRGTRVFVDVSERRKPPDLIDKKVPCNLVASKDGVIYSIVAKEGLEMVKVGDTVIKGQLLVTGRIENKNNKDAPPLMVHSLGTVRARTWYQASAEVEQKVTKAQRTGLQKDMYSLVLFTKKFKLFHSEIPYNNADHVELKKSLTLGKNLVLPFAWVTDQYYEYELKQYTVDPETAKKNASDKAMRKVQELIPKNAAIVRNDVAFSEDENGKITVIATMECIEDIGFTQEIGGM